MRKTNKEHEYQAEEKQIRNIYKEHMKNINGTQHTMKTDASQSSSRRATRAAREREVC